MVLRTGKMTWNTEELNNAKFGLGKKPKADTHPLKKSTRRKVECIELSHKFLYRRAFGETQLLDALADAEFKDGNSYHCITGGDVDSLSFLKVILRKQKLDYLLFSTWCMSAEDVLQFDEWLTEGRIKKLDAYVGEIFPSSYVIEFKMLNEILEKHKCGRVAVFKNHSKIYAGYGDKFHFVIESSANINTNPRTENGCISIGKELFEFYKSFFDGIKTITKDE